MFEKNIYFRMAADMLTSSQSQQRQRMTLINLGGLAQSAPEQYSSEIAVEILNGVWLAVRNYAWQGALR